jgi:amino acid transporter
MIAPLSMHEIEWERPPLFEPTRDAEIERWARQAGAHAPVAILVACGLALLSALSFTELSARHPLSAGEAFYVQEAFGHARLSTLVGWLVIATGVVSAATLANAIAVFAAGQIPLSGSTVVVVAVLGLGLVTAWGIGESVLLAVAITVVEVGGLGVVLAATAGSYAQLPARLGDLVPGLSAPEWSGIGLGAFLIFYTFIGFEDMVNIAEEVKQPRRSLPVDILLALALTGLLYFLVVLALVLSVPLEELAATGTPLRAAEPGTAIPEPVPRRALPGPARALGRGSALRREDHRAVHHGAVGWLGHGPARGRRLGARRREELGELPQRGRLLQLRA